MKKLLFIYCFLGVILGCNNPFVPPKAPRPGPPELIYPNNGDTLPLVKDTVTFSWQYVAKSDTYCLQVSNTPDFGTCIEETALVRGITCTYTFSDTTLTYYWRLRVQTMTYHEWSDWCEPWWFVVRKLPNAPPIQPYSECPPDGATEVSVMVGELEWKSGDPDGDIVIYTIYFGTDETFPNPPDTIVDSSGAKLRAVGYEIDTLDYETTYYWKVNVMDYPDSAQTCDSLWRFRTRGTPNHPPEPPEKPSVVPSPGYIDEACTFTTKAMDPDGDTIRYRFDFGDGHQSEWTPWVPSGGEGSVTYAYNKVGTFYVKAEAQDMPFDRSGWSDSTDLLVKVGPGACWVADVHGNKAVKLSIGGSWICQFDDQHGWPWGHIYYMKEPVTLGVYSGDGSCWVACTHNQSLFALAPACTGYCYLFGSQVEESNPSTPCPDENGDCWVTLARAKKFVKIEHQSCAIIDSIYDPITGPVYPIAIALDEPYIWTVERSFTQDGYVSKFDIPTKVRIFKVSKCDDGTRFNGSWVEVDPVTHFAWVANEMTNCVVKIHPDGTSAKAIHGFKNPCCVSVDPAYYWVWVADRENDRVVKLSEEGDRVLVKYGFENPTGAEVDAQDGSCWVSDAGNHRIVKLSSGGDILFTVSGFTTPMGLSVNPNPEP